MLIQIRGSIHGRFTRLTRLLVQSPKRQARSASRVVFRYTARNLLLDVLLEMEAQLFVYIAPDVGVSIGTASPTSLLTYSRALNDSAITLDFKQHVSVGDALRAVRYSKTLTFTLSTTTP